MKMKRKIKSSVALLLSIALLATNGGFSTMDSVKAASSSTATDLNCWDYTIDGDNVILSKIKQLDADDSITVSSTYTLDDKTYKTIIDSTDNVCSPFYNADNFEKVLNPYSVTIANGVTFKSNSTANLFNMCSNLKSLDLSAVDLSAITNTSSMFANCNKLTHISVKSDAFLNVKEASYMFSSCEKLKDVSELSFPEVQNASFMFSWSGVTDFDCSIIPKATDLTGLLSGCSDLSSFSFGSLDLVGVTSISEMLRGTAITELNFDGADLSNIKNFSYLAAEMSNLVSFSFGDNVIDNSDFHYMLFNCPSLKTVDLSAIKDSSGLTNASSILQGSTAIQTLKTPACIMDLPIYMIDESENLVNFTDGTVQTLRASTQREINITFQLNTENYRIVDDPVVVGMSGEVLPRIPEYEKVTTGTFSSEYEEDSDEWNKEHEEWLQKQPKDLDFLGWFDEDGNSVDFDWKIPNHDITVTGKFKDPDTKVLCKVNYYIPSASGYVLHSTDYEYKYPGEVYSPAVKILGDLVSPDVQSVTVVSGKECQVDYYYSKQEVTSEVYAFYQKVDGSYDTDISTATKIDTLSGSKGEEKAFSLAETGTFEGVTKTLVVTGEPIYVQIPRKTQEITFTCDKGIKSLQVDFQDVEKGFKKSFYIGQSVVLSATAKDGYMLKSWSTGGVSQEVTVVVTQDTTSVSVNSEHIAFPIHYQNFDENYNELTEGIVNNNPTNYFIDSDDIHLQQPKLKGYEFVGWRINDSEDTVTSYTIPTGSNKLYDVIAYWRKISVNYTVKYYSMNSDGKTYTEIEASSIDADSISSLADLSGTDILEQDAEYYEQPVFKNSDTDIISDLTQVLEDYQINVYFDRKKYSVTINNAKHLRTSLSVPDLAYWGQEINVTCNSLDDDYLFDHFSGDFLDFDIYTNSFSFTMPKSDVILNTNETLNSCTVTFDSQTNGGSDDNLSITELCTNEIALGDYSSSKDGYEFIGWNTNPNATKALDTVTTTGKSMTLYAIFKKQVVINVVTADGSDQKVTTAYNNAELPAVEFNEFEKDFEDHKFIGWTTTDSLSEGVLDSIGKLSGVEDGSTIYAVYGDEIISHFVINDREVKDCKSGKYYHSLDLSSPLISSITSPEVDDSEWIFKGFSLDSDSAEISVLPGQTVTPVKSETYYAVFEKEYSVEYSNVTDTVIAQRIGAGVQSTDEYRLREFTGSADTGYKFTGWIIGDEKYQPGSLFSPNTLVTTVEASLEPISYEIRFSNEDCNGQMQSVFAKYNEDITLPHCTLSKDGYSFIGWSLDQSSKVSILDGAICKNLSDTNDAAVTLYPVWQKVNQVSPSASPSISPSASSSTIPSAIPSVKPSSTPSVLPSVTPSVSPSVLPNVTPSVSPSSTPCSTPSVIPSVEPSSTPSVSPSSTPSVIPSVAPSNTPDNAQYFIQFNANGGVGVMHLMQLGMNEKAALPECGFAKDSKYFIGWALSPNGTAVYKDREIILSLTSVANSVVNLFAVWGDNTPVVSPSATPSILPSSTPSIMPTLTPSNIPTLVPSDIPIYGPTNSPVAEPSIKPIVTPTIVPTKRPDLIITTDVPTQTPIATTEPTIVPNTNAPVASEPVRTPNQVTPIEIPTVSPKSNVIQGIRNVPTSAPAEDPGEQDVKKVSSKSLIGSTVCVSNCNYTILSNSACALVGRTDSVSTLVVSKTVIISGKRYKITQISDDAFSGSMLKFVTIGNNVQKIGKRSFKNCKSLKKVKLGKSVKTISQNAFSGCSALKTIKITSRMIISVKKNAFNGVNSKIVIDVPDGMQKYYKKLFTKSGLSKKVKFV